MIHPQGAEASSEAFTWLVVVVGGAVVVVGGAVEVVGGLVVVVLGGWVVVALGSLVVVEGSAMAEDSEVAGLVVVEIGLLVELAVGRDAPGWPVPYPATTRATVAKSPAAPTARSKPFLDAILTSIR